MPSCLLKAVHQPVVPELHLLGEFKHLRHQFTRDQVLRSRKGSVRSLGDFDGCSGLGVSWHGRDSWDRGWLYGLGWLSPFEHREPRSLVSFGEGEGVYQFLREESSVSGIRLQVLLGVVVAVFPEILPTDSAEGFQF